MKKTEIAHVELETTNMSFIIDKNSGVIRISCSWIDKEAKRGGCITAPCELETNATIKKVADCFKDTSIILIKCDDSLVQSTVRRMFEYHDLTKNCTIATLIPNFSFNGQATYCVAHAGSFIKCKYKYGDYVDENGDLIIADEPTIICEN